MARSDEVVDGNAFHSQGVAINDSNFIAGDYTDSNNVSHGFHLLRPIIKTNYLGYTAIDDPEPLERAAYSGNSCRWHQQ